jgi:hypothetical protein
MDPLGKFVLTDGQSWIVIDSTYLDSWLSSLISALNRLRSTDRVTVEISEEPDSIEIVVAADGKLRLSYKNQNVSADSLKELEVSLRAAVGSLLNVLNNLPDTSQNRFIDPIKRFWATTQN